MLHPHVVTSVLVLGEASSGADQGGGCSVCNIVSKWSRKERREQEREKTEGTKKEKGRGRGRKEGRRGVFVWGGAHASVSKSQKLVNLYTV